MKLRITHTKKTATKVDGNVKVTIYQHAQKVKRIR